MLLVQDIVTATADATGLTPAALRSQDRCKAVARPRQVAMFLATRLTRQSLPAIGRLVGHRDHTTVLHANRRIEGILAGDGGYDVACMVTMVLDRLGVADLPPPRKACSPEQYRASQRAARTENTRAEIARCEAHLARLRSNLATLTGSVQ